MLWRDTVTLVATTNKPDAEGYKTRAETRREVFADKQSAKRSEFYSARQSGDRIDIVFLVRAIDYDHETRIEHEGKSYDVVRSYTRAGEVYELNCTETPPTPAQEPAGATGEEAGA
jgi:SPP1 family predicted phage head-tail adaptor